MTTNTLLPTPTDVSTLSTATTEPTFNSDLEILINTALGMRFVPEDCVPGYLRGHDCLLPNAPHINPTTITYVREGLSEVGRKEHVVRTQTGQEYTFVVEPQFSSLGKQNLVTVRYTCVHPEGHNDAAEPPDGKDSLYLLRIAKQPPVEDLTVQSMTAWLNTHNGWPDKKQRESDSHARFYDWYTARLGHSCDQERILTYISVDRLKTAPGTTHLIAISVELQLPLKNLGLSTSRPADPIVLRPAREHACA